MIHLHTAETFDDGQCDYCAEALEPGVYTTVCGYTLISKPPGYPEIHVHGPFVPCTRCYGMLRLPAVDFDTIQEFHKLIAVKLRISPSVIRIEVDND